MNTGILKILMAVLQVAPLAASTISNIMRIISNDPAVPPDLKALLQKTADNNAAALSESQAWLLAHPE